MFLFLRNFDKDKWGEKESETKRQGIIHVKTVTDAIKQLEGSDLFIILLIGICLSIFLYLPHYLPIHLFQMMIRMRTGLTQTLLLYSLL